MMSLLNPRNFANHLRRRRLRLGPEIVQVDFLGTRILVKAREDVGQSMALGSFELDRSEEHTSELQSLMRISYAVFCLKKKTKTKTKINKKHITKKKPSYDTALQHTT